MVSKKDKRKRLIFQDASGNKTKLIEIVQERVTFPVMLRGMKDSV